MVNFQGEFFLQYLLIFDPDEWIATAVRVSNWGRRGAYNSLSVSIWGFVKAEIQNFEMEQSKFDSDLFQFMNFSKLEFAYLKDNFDSVFEAQLI